MKNVKVILLLSVILSFIYFIKINEGFGPFDLYNYLTGDDTGTGTGAGTGTGTEITCPTTVSTDKDVLRRNTSLMETCSSDDAIRNLNDSIDILPDATLVYPKDPVSIEKLQFLPEDLDSTNTTISYGGEDQTSFSNILKNGEDLQPWWNYNFHDSTETPELNIINSTNEEIHKGMDLVYLSGCSQIITSDMPDNTPSTCHENINMTTCNTQDGCVWDALCEQPHRDDTDLDKIYTPKECIRNGGIFRTDLLHYAKNTIVGGNISTSFNMKDITDLWFKTTANITEGQNDSDSCSFFPTSTDDTYYSELFKSSKVTDSYLDISCYHPIIKRLFGDTADVDDTIGLDTHEKITTKKGALFTSDNPYNNPLNLFDFKIDESNCTWSSRMDTPENFASCFSNELNIDNLPQSGWSSYTCENWASNNRLDICFDQPDKTRIDNDKKIPQNISEEEIIDNCCVPQFTCTNIHGIDPESPDTESYQCGSKWVLNVNAETCSEDGCSKEECCVRNHNCMLHQTRNGIECSEDTFIKHPVEHCFETNNETNLCDNFQDYCCEEHPMCVDIYSSDEGCQGGYYLDTTERCSTHECLNDGNCCKPEAACYNFQCNAGYRLKNNGRTSCPTNESSCNHSICCEPEPTCSDMSGSITCSEGKILDDNKIYEEDNEEDNQDGNGGCCIDDEIICANPTGIGWEERSVLSFDSSTNTLGNQCNRGFDENEVWTYTNDIVDLERRQHIQQMTLDLTSPISNCGAEADSFQCPADKPILDTYKPCTGDSCDAETCCKTETYFCKGPDFSTDSPGSGSGSSDGSGNSNTKNVIYQDAVLPQGSISDSDPSSAECSSDTLTDFIWQSCSDALRSIDLSSYPYIGNIYQACGVEPPSEQSGVGDARIPTTLDSHPRCSADICPTGKVLRSNIPPICNSNPCTDDECCEDENTCANYYLSNECPAGNKTDGQCVGVCTPQDCCLPSNTINLSLQIGDDPSTGTASGSGQSSSFNTILQTYLNKMIIVPDTVPDPVPDPSKVYFTSDSTWNRDDTSSFFTMKYTPTDNISPASSITDPNTDPNTDPDSNSIKFYVKGSYESPDISNLVRLDDITGDGNGNRDILTFIVELNNLHFKSSVSNNIPLVGDIIFNCGDSNFQSSDIYLYKFLLYKENNNLKLYTSSDHDKDTFINSSLPSPSDTDIEYDIGTIDGDKITFVINDILTQISSNLSSPTPNTFEGILLKLLMLKTDDIHDMFFGDTSATITAGGYRASITNGNNNLQDKICSLDLDINQTDSWNFESTNPSAGFYESLEIQAINSGISTYDFTTLTTPSTPGIDNFVKYDNGLSFNTHFTVCPDTFTISDIPSLIIRLKELILTGIDIYTLYTSNTRDQFNKDPTGCSGSSTLVDGSVFTPEEITTINSFISDFDISNLQYTSSPDTPSSDNIHYTDGGKNIDTIVLTIS